MVVYHRGKYGALKVFSILHCPKTMKNSCILTLLVDSFRQFDQNQSVVNYFLLFEVHITLGFKSEVSIFILNASSWKSNLTHDSLNCRLYSIATRFPDVGN